MSDNVLMLNRLFAPYYKVNRGKRYEVFYSEHNNNLIVFSPLDKECDTESICNSIQGEVYHYLIKTLNENKGIVVHWSQVEGTTSDYDIHFDQKPEELKQLSYTKIIKLLSESLKTHVPTKYRIIRNGGHSVPISREEMKALWISI